MSVLLGDTLTSVEEIDCRELAMKIHNFPDVPKESMTAWELLTFVGQNEVCELHPNLCIVLRITYTFPVTSTSAERSFSEFKLMDTYVHANLCGSRLREWTDNNQH